MNDGILSQDEIDALLKGDNSSYTQPSPPTTVGVQLNDFEMDTVGEIGNISMGTAATTLSTLLKKKVSITTPTVFVTTTSQLRDEYPLPFVVIEVKYTEGMFGTNVLIMKEQDACIIADIMMGGDGHNPDMNLGEITLSAVSEAMNQMMGSATTSMSTMFGMRIDISPPLVNQVDLGKESLDVLNDNNEIVQIKFKMEIDGLLNSEIMQFMPIDAVKEMVRNLVGDSAPESSLEAIIEESRPVPQMPQPEPVYVNPMPPPPAPPVMQMPPPQPMWGNQGYNDMPQGVKKGEQYAVQPVQFAPLQEAADSAMPQNIGLILDVPLDVTVELGKTRKTIKEVLELTSGSIIQLDKMAGEPVDLMVNGKLIAKGEVVVIDENYGIRITTILSPLDRMNKLQ